MGKLIVVGVAAGLAGCFPGPLPLEVDGDGDVAEVAAETAEEVVADADAEVVDATGVTEVADVTEVDAAEVDEVDAAVTSDADASEDGDVGPTCGGDGECAHLTLAPCVVGRCVEQACKAVHVNVPCDDGDPCTTADACAGGACAGRAFTEAEAASWAYSFGDDGADGAFDAAPYDEDEVVVVGGFQGDLTPPGGPTLTSATGSLDAFVMRVSSRGQIIRASRIGTEEDEVATLVAVGGNRDVVVAYVQRSSAGVVTSTLAWMFDNGNVRASVDVPGVPVALDVGADGEAYVATEITGAVSIELRDGSDLSIDPMSARAVVIARVDMGGIAWAKGIIGPGRSSANSVVATRGSVWLTAHVEAETSFGGEILVAPGDNEGGWTFELDRSGVVLGRTDGDPRFLERHGYDRYAAMSFDAATFDDAFCGGEFEVGGSLASTACHVSLSCDLEDTPPSGAGGLVVPAPDGSFAIHGSARAPYDFGGGVVLDGSSDELVFVYYDATCAPIGLWTASLALFNDLPDMRFAFGLNDLRTLYSHPAFTDGGALVIASVNRLPTTLGAPFPANTNLLPNGSSDLVLAGFSVATLRGCTVER